MILKLWNGRDVPQSPTSVCCWFSLFAAACQWSTAAGRNAQWSVEPSHRVGGFYLGSHCPWWNLFGDHLQVENPCHALWLWWFATIGMGVNEALSIVQKMGSAFLSAWPTSWKHTQIDTISDHSPFQEHPGTMCLPNRYCIDVYNQGLNSCINDQCKPDTRYLGPGLPRASLNPLWSACCRQFREFLEGIAVMGWGHQCSQHVSNIFPIWVPGNLKTSCYCMHC